MFDLLSPSSCYAANPPLAACLRPRAIEGIIDPQHLLGADKTALMRLITVSYGNQHKVVACAELLHRAQSRCIKVCVDAVHRFAKAVKRCTHQGLIRQFVNIFVLSQGLRGRGHG